MMLCRITSAILLLLSGNVWAQEVFADPISEFLRRNPRYSNPGKSIEELFLVKADISGDGQPEVFLSHKDMYVYRPGRTWNVYTPVNGGFRRIDNVAITGDSGEKRTHQGLIRFRTDAFHVGNVEGAEGTTLFSFWPSGSGRGGLIGIWLEDGALVTRKVRDLLVGHGGPDSDFYNRVFGTERGQIVKAKVEDLATEAQRMALIGAPPPDSTAGFVSRTPDEADAGQEESTLSSQEAGSAADAPSGRAALDEGADEPAAVAEAAPSEETQRPEGPGWPGGLLVISIGAVAFLLALAGYRVFPKKGRSGQ